MVRPRLLWIPLLLLCSFVQAPPAGSRSEGPWEELALRRLGAVQNLKLDLQGKRVTVHGKVKNYFERRAAERALLKLRGIASVDNRITVHPPARTDVQIKTDINTALQTQGWLNPRKIVVKVLKNVVTLNGSVERLPERDLIEEIAGSVRGVKDVVNEIKIEPGAGGARPGEAIKQEVETALLAELGEAVRKALTVEVSNGVVTLRGAVRNYYEKMGAYQAASAVPGVGAVNNALEIE